MLNIFIIFVVLTVSIMPQNLKNKSLGIDASLLHGSGGKSSMNGAFDFMKKERWKPVKGYEDLYHVSTFGNVKALCVEKYRGRFKHKQPERLLRLKTHRDGYLIATLTHNGISRCFQAHRLVTIAFRNNPKNKPFVNHKNGNKKDNFYLNLEWCTAAENSAHALKTGLFKPPQGESVGTSKLKANQVKEIFLSDKPRRELAAKYKIGRTQIDRIQNGTRWAHLTKTLKA